MLTNMGIKAGYLVGSGTNEDDNENAYKAIRRMQSSPLVSQIIMNLVGGRKDGNPS